MIICPTRVHTPERIFVPHRYLLTLFTTPPPSFTFSAAGTIDFVEFAKWQLSNEERDQGAHGNLADISRLVE